MSWTLSAKVKPRFAALKGFRMLIPELDHFSGSWIVLDRETRKPVFETFNRYTAGKVNQARYEVLTAYKALCEINARKGV
jgi:hypothetical protein